MNLLPVFLVPLVVVFLTATETKADGKCEDAVTSSTGLCKRWAGLCHHTRVATVCARSCQLCGEKVKRAKPKYEGCFRDARLAGFKMVFVRKLNVRSCTDRCKRRGHAYAALQNSMFCMCGDDYSKMPEISKRDGCIKRCAGTNDACGGLMQNSIYQTEPKVKKRYLDVNAVEELILGKEVLEEMKRKLTPKAQDAAPLFVPKKRDWNFDNWLRKFVSRRHH